VPSRVLSLFRWTALLVLSLCYHLRRPQASSPKAVGAECWVCLGGLRYLMNQIAQIPSSCANREARGVKFHPTQPPVGPVGSWVGWRWSRGSNLVTGPLGSVAGEPDWRQRQLLCLLPVQAAGAWQVRRRVCSAHIHAPAARMQVHAPAARVTPRPTFAGVITATPFEIRRETSPEAHHSGSN
jgi:hypothetical protein